MKDTKIGKIMESKRKNDEELYRRLGNLLKEEVEDVEEVEEDKKGETLVFIQLSFLIAIITVLVGINT